MKEVLLISDKGGTGKTTLMKMMVEIVGRSAVYADCTFTSTWHTFPDIIQEDLYYLGQEAIVDDFLCIGCGDCEDACNFKAIHIIHGQAQVVRQSCTGCGHCIQVCPANALTLKQVIGGKIIQKNANGAIIVYGTLQYYPRNGIRPVRIVRDKAVDVILSYQKKLLICEAYPGWSRLTFSLIPFANILMPIVEPHPQVFEFLDNLKNYQHSYKSNIVLIVNKYDLNASVTNQIIAQYPQWNILTLPYSNTYMDESYDKLKSFIIPLLG